jgi:glycosyltransferase involved in cell wall biosynthesis
MIKNRQSGKNEKGVSVAIPTYDSEDTIRETIKSVLSQSVDVGEIIVVDDRSTDQTVEVIEEMSKKYSSVKYHTNDENRGLFENHNRCVKKANEEWILFLHSDDKLKENSLKIYKKYIMKYPKFDVFLPTNRKNANRVGPGPLKLLGPKDSSTILRWHSGMVSGSVYKKSTIKEHEFDAGTLSADWELPMRILLSGGGVLILPEPVIKRYFGDKQTSTKVSREGSWNRHRSVALKKHICNDNFRQSLISNVKEWEPRELYSVLILLSYMKDRRLIGQIVSSLKTADKNVDVIFNLCLATFFLVSARIPARIVLFSYQVFLFFRKLLPIDR